jgi:hypothetical protein
MRCRETLCSLFSIENPIPKLNVAGSIPVSRSRFFEGADCGISTTLQPL